MLHPQMVFHKDYPEKKTLKEIKKKEVYVLVICLIYFLKNLTPKIYVYLELILFISYS